MTHPDIIDSNFDDLIVVIGITFKFKLNLLGKCGCYRFIVKYELRFLVCYFF